MKNIIFLLFSLLTINSFSQKKTDSIPKWKMHGRFAFIFNQSSFSNWASGGENTVAGNININYDLNYKKDNLNPIVQLAILKGLTHQESKQAYKKALELNPNDVELVDGAFRLYFNSGYDKLKDDQKLVDEINANLANKAKYDELMAKRKSNFSTAMPSFEYY